MKIPVKAGKDKMVHFPVHVKAAPGGRTLCISGDTIVEVDNKHRYVRRRLKVKDLVRPTKEEIKAEAEKAKAAAEKAKADAKEAEVKAKADARAAREKEAAELTAHPGATAEGATASGPPPDDTRG